MYKRIFLVTGASGHLGNTVIRQLLQRGERVRCLVYEEELPISLEKLNCEFIHGDITDAASLERFFAGLEGWDVYVLHLASMISIASDLQPQIMTINVGGTENILRYCFKYKVKRLLYCSSVHAIPEKKYNAPISEVDSFNPDWVNGAYAKTKALASQLVLEAGKDGLDVVIVHPSGIIGPYDYLGTGHINQVISQFLEGKVHTIVRGGYDLVDVRDVALGLLEALAVGKNGSCYILSNEYISIESLLQQVAKLSGKPPVRHVLSLGFVKILAPLMEWWANLRNKRPLFTTYSLYTLASNANFSHKKASRELDYQPRPFKNSLLDTIKFLKARDQQSMLLKQGKTITG